MPDTKGFDTLFKDYVADKMPFQQVPTLGNDPTNWPVDSKDAGVSGTVTPKELPSDQLFHS